MAALIDAIEVKRKNFSEFENTPYLCLQAAGGPLKRHFGLSGRSKGIRAATQVGKASKFPTQRKPRCALENKPLRRPGE
jgi:hypothetical protein